jgi:hypothetical protein
LKNSYLEDFTKSVLINNLLMCTIQTHRADDLGGYKVLEITVDTKDIEAALTAAPNQLRYATQQGINKTAYDVQGGVRQAMPTVFDRPTPFTINSLKVYPANQTTLTADINFKGKPSDHYLRPEVFGGPRPQKIFEKRLGSYLIPGKDAPLDRYGNVSGAQIVRMLSVLGMAQPGQNRTEGSAKRKMRTLSGYKEFVVIDGNIYERVPEAGRELSAKAKKGLKPGVYQKAPDGSVRKARGLKLWFFAPKKDPAYKPLLHYNKISKQTIDTRLADNIRKGISMAFKRAGK